MTNSVIVNKSFNFALDIISTYHFLTCEKREFILSKQLPRAGTSIGANVREAFRGESRKDFGHKMNIALKEANETEYWIELLIASSYLEDEVANEMLNKCKELCKILNSIVRKVRETQEVQDA